VLTRHGDGRFDVICLGDGQRRLGHVCGKLWKRTWVTPHDLVLVCLRPWQDGKADIVHKYSDEEERALVTAGELPEGTSLGRKAEDDAYNSELPGVARRAQSR